MMISDKVKQLARAGGKNKKLAAIRALRKATGMDLASVREIVETLAAGGEVQLETPAPTSPIGETREQKMRRQLEAISGVEGAGVLNDQEIGKLLEILQEDEDLLALAKGTYDRCSGVLVATQKRLLFMNRDMADGPRVKKFLLDLIYLVRHEAAFLSPTGTCSGSLYRYSYLLSAPL